VGRLAPLPVSRRPARHLRGNVRPQVGLDIRRLFWHSLEHPRLNDGNAAEYAEVVRRLAQGELRRSSMACIHWNAARAAYERFGEGSAAWKVVVEVAS